MGTHYSSIFDWLYFLVLLLAALAGLFLNIVGLPGLWLILACAAAYGWLTGFAYVGLYWILVLLGFTVLAEVVEFVAGSAGAKAAGSSKRGMLGAIVGGLAGAIFGSVFIPIPILGTIIGAVAGSFVAAAFTEFSIVGRSADHSVRVGYGAAKGRLLGILSKSAIGAVMCVLLFIAALPIRRRHAATPATRPAPATQQAATAAAVTQP